MKDSDNGDLRRFNPNSVIVKDGALAELRAAAGELETDRNRVYGIAMEIAAEDGDKLRRRFSEEVA